jgi:hypothetical protein
VMNAMSAMSAMSDGGIKDADAVTIGPYTGKARGWKGCAWAGLLLAWYLLMVVGCRPSTERPPGFSDFQRALQMGSDTEAGVEAQVEVFAAAMLSEKEQRVILSGTNVEAMVGGGLNGNVNDVLCMRLLERAVELSPSNRVAWAAMAYRSYTVKANKAAGSGRAEVDFGKAIAAWKRLDPSNSVPVYLEGSFESLRTNLLAAKELMVQASRMKDFETYQRALQECVIQSMELVGSSHFTARIVACGHSSEDVVCWPKLNSAILESTPSEEEVRMCLLLGRRVGGGKSSVVQLVGDSIMTKAGAKLDSAAFAEDAKRIAERKEAIKRATKYLNSERTRKATEKQWVEYYDKSFDSGEMEAVRALAMMLGDEF